MILKTLVTGVAAAAVVAAAAGGVTSVASNASSGVPAVTPVVLGIPMPQTPAPELQGPLAQTLNVLAGPGSFAGNKSNYVEGGFGGISGRVADRKYNSAVSKGYLPLTIALADIDQNGNVASANVTATLNTGDVRSMPMTFVQSPVSPTGWQLSGQSVTDLGSLLG